MAFSSVEFGLFFAAIVVAYVAVRQNFRWVVLLFGSFVFYSWLGKLYLPMALAVIILVAYFFGKWIAEAPGEGRRRKFLWLGIALILVIFAGLRYFNSLYRLADTARGAFGGIVRQPIIVTVGISFISFQAISYLIDVFRGICAHERHMGYLALSLSYFPKLLQGPLEHSGTITPQLRATHINSYDSIRTGILLFAWGLCKKVIIADRMAAIVNQVFGNVQYYHGLSLVIAVYAFAIQIYADFSGYTDMAIGMSRIFSISLTDNFNQPYFSTSFADFWRKWHITFMNWLREYIFMPLQITWRNHRIIGPVAAILVVFGISGLWHGVGLTFLVWGLLNGLLVAGGFVFQALSRHKEPRNRENAIGKFCKIIIVFNVTCLVWVFFRANSIQDAIYVITHFAQGAREQVTSLSGFERAIRIGQTRSETALTWALVVIYCCVEAALFRRGVKFDELIAKIFFKVRWPVYFCIIAALILFSYRESGQFIYFNF